MESTLKASDLNQFIERIEQLEEEKAAISEDIRETFKEAKNLGFDLKALKIVIKLRKMDESQRQEEEEMVNLYKEVLGL